MIRKRKKNYNIKKSEYNKQNYNNGIDTDKIMDLSLSLTKNQWFQKY